jgi:3-dehydroquinate synthase
LSAKLRPGYLPGCGRRYCQPEDMKTINVKLKEHSYPIIVGHRILTRLGRSLRRLHLGRDAVIVTNPLIKRLHGAALTEGLRKEGYAVKSFEVPDGEQSKSAAVAFHLIEKIARYDVRKKIFIVAFGGGVIGDLAGYVAAAYKRGIPYIQVPTTLLAQIDSSIGGKVAIDLPVGKNLVGAFYQPKMVFSDTDVLATLNQRQIRNGLAEAVKYGVICDPRLFSYLESHVSHLLEANPKVFKEVVLRCSRIKARVVMADEKETKGLRTVLNFGHTAGHAIEAAGKFEQYHHGEAVALGMRVAAELSTRLDMLEHEAAERMGRLLDKIGLPSRIRGVSVPAILRHMEHDKKFEAGKNKFVLAERIGKVKVVEGVPQPLIMSAMKTCM